MRRSLPYLVALVLGAGAALLAACAGGTDGGVGPKAASDLKSQLGDVRMAVDSAKCARLSSELRHVIRRIDELPSSVDRQLQQRLRDGYDNLKDEALTECNSNSDERTTTTEIPTNTTPAPTQPQTQPRTQTQTPTQTQTQPTPPPPPPVNPQPPSAGGGTPPEETPP